MQFFRIAVSGFSLLCILSIFFFPGFADSASILDEIDFVLIRDMQLRKEKGAYFFDVTSVVRNSGEHTLKLTNCKLDLSFTPEDSKTIELGSTFKDEILLEKKKPDSQGTDTNLHLSANIGSDIEAFHFKITSSEEMSSQLMEPKPKLNLHIQGGFELGMKLKRGWVYQPGIKIDWILQIEVVRDVFVKTYKAVELAAGKSSNVPADAEEDDEFLADFDEEDEPSLPIDEKGKTLTADKTIVYFSPNQKTLDKKATKIIQEWMGNIQKNSDGRILHIKGYSDGGNLKDNKSLSQSRAKAVHEYLVNTLGMKWKHVKVNGLVQKPGDDKNSNSKGRVELYFTNG